MPSSLESLSLDGLALNDATTFDLESFEFNPAAKRQRWISGEDADGDVLAEPSRAGNRPAIVTLRVVPQADMDTALSKIGQIVDKLYEAEQQPDGLALAWTPADSTKSATAYVLSGEITDLPISLDAGWFAKAPTITLRLDCLPYMEGTTLTSFATATASTPYVSLTLASVPGDVPAKGVLRVTDGATKSRRHVEWGLQWRYYDAATSLYVDSDNLVTSGFAGSQTTRTGADDPGASGNTVVRGTLTTAPVAICGLGNLGHVGSFRVKARVYANPTSDATADDFKVRLSWKEGDGPLRSNGYTSPAVSAGWSEVDLGVVNIPPKTLGTQRWTGQVEAYSEDAGDTLDVDYLLLFPTNEGYGKARAPFLIATSTAFSARDEFDQTAGNLNGKTLPVGGTWATSGAATDLATSGSGVVTRTTTSDAAGGRVAIAGTATFTDVAQRLDFKWSAAVTNAAILHARWVDSSHYFYTLVRAQSAPYIEAGVDGGTGVTGTGFGTRALHSLSVDTMYSLWTQVLADGSWGAAVTLQGQVPTTWDMQGKSSDLATGGVLASGKAGFADINGSASACTRTYDNFLVWVPSSDAAVFSGRSAEIRYDGAQRADSTGTYYGPISSYRGSRFFVPPAGDESRTSRVLVTAKRNDVATAADDQIADSTTVTVDLTPRYSTAPR